jgi:hypothetical protein
MAGHPPQNALNNTIVLANNQVTYAKMQQVVAGALVGNPTVGTANVQAIALDPTYFGYTGSGPASLTTTPTFSQVARVTLTSVNLLAMYATPVQIIESPGLTSAIIIDQVTYRLNYGTVAYSDSGGNFGLQYGSAAHFGGAQATTQSNSNIFTETESSIVTATVFTNLLTISAVANTAVYISNDSAALITGDSTMDVFVRYHILPTV